jgi:hypothetical protein
MGWQYIHHKLYHHGDARLNVSPQHDESDTNRHRMPQWLANHYKAQSRLAAQEEGSAEATSYAPPILPRLSATIMTAATRSAVLEYPHGDIVSASEGDRLTDGVLKKISRGQVEIVVNGTQFMVALGDQAGSAAGMRAFNSGPHDSSAGGKLLRTAQVDFTRSRVVGVSLRRVSTNSR